MGSIIMNIVIVPAYSVLTHTGKAYCVAIVMTVQQAHASQQTV